MFTPTTAILVGTVALIVFGPKQLPELAKSLGKAMGEFKKGLNGEPDPIAAGQPGQPDQTALPAQAVVQTVQAPVAAPQPVAAPVAPAAAPPAGTAPSEAAPPQA